MLGVFTFAGVVALPYQLLLALVAAVYLAAWPTYRRAGLAAHKHAYSAAAVGMACWGASATLTYLPDLIALPVAVGSFMVINLALLSLGILVSGDRAALPYLHNPRVYAMVFGTQWLGAALGLCVHGNSLGSFAVLPVIAVVHREALRSAVRRTGACAGGIWNRAGWLALAEEAHRVKDRFSLILVELPDRHEANIAADVVQARLGEETIGRYSDTHLVVLLRESTDTAARYLALRLGIALDKAALHAGVGCADSQAGSVAGMLAAAAGEAVICRAEDADSELH